MGFIIFSFFYVLIFVRFSKNVIELFVVFVILGNFSRSILLGFVFLFSFRSSRKGIELEGIGRDYFFLEILLSLLLKFRRYYRRIGE